jgi:nucleotide-binding universal stress UspA family protein
MSLAMIKSLQGYETSSREQVTVLEPKQLKVLIPYDGSDGAETALRDLERAGLPQRFEAMIAVTQVWLPSSPYEITRAVDARRLKLLTSGMSSFAPARRDCEEQRVLSREADRSVRSMFPSANVTTEILEESNSIASDLVRVAKTYGVELIIVGSKGSPSPQINDYAGTALRMATSADCSVRIARPSDRKVGSPAQILIGADEIKSMERVVKVVSERVWPAGTSVNIVLIGDDLGPRDPVRESQIVLALEGLATTLRERRLKVAIAVMYGQRPEDMLLEQAKEMLADCIFLEAEMFSHRQGNGDRGVLGKVAQSVVLGAPCSVEVVRPRILTHEDLDPAA